MGVPQNQGCPFRGPHFKDYCILGSILGFPTICCNGLLGMFLDYFHLEFTITHWSAVYMLYPSGGNIRVILGVYWDNGKRKWKPQGL